MTAESPAPPPAGSAPAGVVVELHERAPEAALALPLDLFRDPRFFELHRASFTRAWYALARDRESGAALAAGWFAEVEPGHARAPGRGTFGGMQLTDARAPLATLDGIAAATEDALRAAGVRRATVLLPPADHAPDEVASWTNVLARAGWSIATPELSYAIDVRAEPLERRMNSGNRYVARTAARRGLTFERLDAGERAAAYAVNVENREKRGYPVTMSLDALLAMEERFPDRVLWFGVRHEGRLIAANVSLLIDASTLYVFYWGEVRGAERLSPVTVLAAGIYEEARARGLRLVDVGTATVAGEPNHGLLAYKRNLGCTASLKLTLSKELT